MQPDMDNFLRELAQLEAESMGWVSLEPGVYLHVGDDNATEVLVETLPANATPCRMWLPLSKTLCKGSWDS